MESSIPEEKPLTGKEDSNSGITLQVSKSEATSEIVSNAPVIECKKDAPRQSQEVSEDSNQGGENVDVVSSKENSTGVELDSDQNTDLNSARGEKLSEAIIRTSKPLCADYRSGSESESVDSETDSSTSTAETTDSSSDSESESDDSQDSRTANTKTVKQKERRAQKDTAFTDLPPIEDLKISVPECACEEVGKISSIVDLLAVVESYQGSAALDIDTVLFLDCGKRTLGKVFDILGPITEPVYTVRFNSEEQIKSLNIEKGQKVYYAPKTPHTTFVFLSEVLKNRGSDASWKDNIEAPSEFQDFSDDEEERLYKNKQKKEPIGENPSKESNTSRKRSFNRTEQTPAVLHPPRPRHPFPLMHRPPRHPVPAPPPPAPFPYNVPPYPGTHILAAPPLYHPAHISGPPFPAFGGLPFQGPSRPFHQPFQPPFQQPFFQQRSHPWGRQMFRPPPPPPPPETQNGNRNTDEKP